MICRQPDPRHSIILEASAVYVQKLLGAVIVASQFSAGIVLSNEKPNVIAVDAVDLGNADLGCRGS